MARGVRVRIDRRQLGSVVDDPELLLALEDAVSPIVITEKYERQRRKRARDEAREWFLSGDRDFRDVCALAGMEPERVQEYARRKIEASIAHGDIENKGNPGEKCRKYTKKRNNMKAILARSDIRQLIDNTGLHPQTIKKHIYAGFSIEQIKDKFKNYESNAKKAESNAKLVGNPIKRLDDALIKSFFERLAA